jgi:hypothetical protein
MENAAPIHSVNVRSICFYDAGIVFLRDSNDEVFLLSGEKGAPILCGNSPTELVIDFLHRFPTCSSCIPLAVRRRKAVKAAIKLISLASSQDREQA